MLCLSVQQLLPPRLFVRNVAAAMAKTVVQILLLTSTDCQRPFQLPLMLSNISLSEECHILSPPTASMSSSTVNANDNDLSSLLLLKGHPVMLTMSPRFGIPSTLITIKHIAIN